MDVFKDDRFKHIVNDPKFVHIPKNSSKVKIDKRFQSMFTDEKFKLKYKVDQRGRPIKHTQIDDLKKYYNLVDDGSDEEENENDSLKTTVIKTKSDDDTEESDESEVDETELSSKESELLIPDQIDKSNIPEKVMGRLQDTTVDYARGEGLLDSDSSSSDEPTTEDSESDIEHDWGELDKDADKTDEATKRIAVCHMDWDRVKATDIMVLLHSFLPPTGYIESATIYPSEFGLERMKEEETKGPQELTAKPLEHENNIGESDEKDVYHREKLRQYQMKRLKYYYAVVVFDSAESANKIYTECDRMEYESSATRLDLRFIPDDMEFDQEPKDVCTRLPEAGKYRPLLFANTALQQQKVELTWDETDPNRIDLSRRLAQGASVTDADLKAYIATSSEDSDSQQSSKEDDQEEEKEVENIKNTKDSKTCKEGEISKYRSLLAGIQKEQEAKRTGKVEMEISWDLALENKAKALEEERNQSGSYDKKKKTSKKDNDDLLSDDDLPSDIDTNDPFFKDEFADDFPNRKKKGKDKKKKSDWTVDDMEDEEETRRKAELELLLADDEEEDTSKRHFSLKGIQDMESKKKRKGKKAKAKKLEEDHFKIDVKDERFDALFTSHHFNIDPADSHFRKTKAMDDISLEKSKRRRKNPSSQDMSGMKKPSADGPQLSSEVSQLINSVKKKTKN